MRFFLSTGLLVATALRGSGAHEWESNWECVTTPDDTCSGSETYCPCLDVCFPTIDWDADCAEVTCKAEEHCFFGTCWDLDFVWDCGAANFLASAGSDAGKTFDDVFLASHNCKTSGGCSSNGDCCGKLDCVGGHCQNDDDCAGQGSDGSGCDSNSDCCGRLKCVATGSGTKCKDTNKNHGHSDSDTPPGVAVAGDLSDLFVAYDGKCIGNDDKGKGNKGDSCNSNSDCCGSMKCRMNGDSGNWKCDWDNGSGDKPGDDGVAVSSVATVSTSVGSSGVAYAGGVAGFMFAAGVMVAVRRKMRPASTKEERAPVLAQF